MAVGKDDGVVVGKPLVDGAKVTAKVLQNGKGKRLPSLPIAPRRIPNANGSSPALTKVQVESIT